MKSKLTSFCATIIVAASMAAFPDGDTKPKQNSPKFERMKSLIGTWKGNADIGQGPVEMTVQYRLLAAGTVLEERIFPGTPHEMVTMYFDKDGKLALTHYCMMGNRPAMQLTK